MIRVTRINNHSILLNSDLIEQIETVPDTTIALTTGQRLFVRESADEILSRIIEFRRRISCGIPNGNAKESE
ncbi:MAG: flagellar FlbD family protein [Bryobacteraceae bacterium]|jgi:flagellar protein FlbD